MDTVVVGVDGSPESQVALAEAASHARARGARLRVVTVYGPPDDHSPNSVRVDALTSADQISKQARAAEEVREARERQDHDSAERRMARMLDEVDDLPDEVDSIAVEGTRPARLLIEQARGAALLVVGSRGRGGFKGLLLGSVSQQLASHAPCSLLIARAASDAP